MKDDIDLRLNTFSRESGLDEKEVLIDYTSLEGDHVKVECGPFYKKIIGGRNSNKLRVFSTRVYINGHKVEEYNTDELPKENIYFTKQRLEQLSNYKAPSNEVIPTIQESINHFLDFEELLDNEKDLLERKVSERDENNREKTVYPETGFSFI